MANPSEPVRAGDPADAAGQRRVIEFLSDAATHGAESVKINRTHGAYVFLAGHRALKLKRAVRFPYMDFSTVEKREAVCRAELRLNRRTAPDIYEAVEPITEGPDGALAIGGGGRVVDWVVVMKRFDEAALFDRLADAGGLHNRPRARAAAGHQPHPRPLELLRRAQARRRAARGPRVGAGAIA